MARPTTSPTAKIGEKHKEPWFQYLLPFDPKEVKKEVYDHVKFRALLRKHWGNRSIAAPQRRNPAAGGSSLQSDPYGGDSNAPATSAAMRVGGRREL